MSQGIIEQFFTTTKKAYSDGNVLEMGGLIIQTKNTFLDHLVSKNITWNKPFPHECFMALLQNAQVGFGARDTLCVNNWSTTGCTIGQANGSSAGMYVKVIGIGY